MSDALTTNAKGIAAILTTITPKGRVFVAARVIENGPPYDIDAAVALALYLDDIDAFDTVTAAADNFDVAVAIAHEIAADAMAQPLGKTAR